jgi:hypothetical protein
VSDDCVLYRETFPADEITTSRTGQVPLDVVLPRAGDVPEVHDHP